ncbi:MAG: alpha/beta hydrolase [Roseimicrobium sp.]
MASEPAQTLPIWPDGVQGPVHDTAPERTLPDVPNAKKVLRLEGVTEPTLLAFPAPKDKANGTAVIISPGGGFGRLALDLEGSEVAEYLNTLGVTAFVLKYRTTPAGKPEPQLGAAMDAQRSVSLVRSRAAEFGLQADRIGLLGISAGGQVAVIATSNHAQRLYEAKTDVDHVSCRTDFLALVYPWKIQDATDASKLRADIRLDKTMPPVFIAHAADDKGAKIEGSLLLFLQLQALGVPTEAHLYAKGGHGFGLRPADVPCPTDWPVRLAQWLQVMALVPRS